MVTQTTSPLSPLARTLAHACLLATALTLAACGGGGDGDAPPPNTPTFRVGGLLAGLGVGKTVVIADASGPSAAVSANGAYSLSLPSGTAYSLRVQAQPVGQTCTITNGSGTVTADVNNIGVACLDDVVPPSARTLSGSVAGLGVGKTVVLVLSAGGSTQEASVGADGRFTFTQPVLGDYSVTVRTQPVGQTCSVSGGQGAVHAGDTTPADISVVCAATAYKLSGTVSGNAGVVALRNSGNGDTVTLTGNGAFNFAQPVLAGASYSVGVFDISAGQSCTVGNGSGIATADVTQITVSCVGDAPPPPTPAAPTTPALTLGYGVKTFQLSWTAATAPAGSGPTTYRVTEDPDGAGPAAATQIATGLTGTSYDRVVTGLLHTRLNATYSVQACNTVGCGVASAAQAVDLTKAIGYFKASNTGANDQFGISVALSGDSNTLAVGAYYESSNATGIGGDEANNLAANSGAVYVFTRTSGTSPWSQQAYVKASNTGASDQFGYSVALSGDGNTLAVGAHREDSDAMGIGGNEGNDSAANSGAVYVFTRSGSTWSQQAYVKASNTGVGDEFGYSVALSSDGSTLAVGAHSEDSSATGINGDQLDNTAIQSGAVYAFTRSGGTWSQQAYVKASHTGTSVLFGISVALSGDGNTLAVGAHWEDSNATGIGGDEANNLASNSGAVYVFTRPSGTSTWSQQAYVKASNTEASDYFGSSVALSSDGNTLAVGAIGEDSNATGIGGDEVNNLATTSGAVYVFTRTSGTSTWSQQAYVKASHPGGGDLFGYSVALSGDGNVLAVGAYSEDSNATGIGGDEANNSAFDSGAVYVFTRSGSTWSQQAYVKASNTETSDYFGRSVALSGDGNTLAVGAAGEDSNATGINAVGGQTSSSASGAGAVYVY